MKTCEAEIKIRGMICRACTDAVEAALMSVRGVVSAKASYFKGCAYVTYDPDICDEPTLSHSIENAGYETGEKGRIEYLVDIICAVLTAFLVWLLMDMKLNVVPS